MNVKLTVMCMHVCRQPSSTEGCNNRLHITSTLAKGVCRRKKGITSKLGQMTPYKTQGIFKNGHIFLCFSTLYSVVSMCALVMHTYMYNLPLRAKGRALRTHREILQT